MTATTSDIADIEAATPQRSRAADAMRAAQGSGSGPGERVSFPRKVWRLLVAIKDFLALLFLLMFFGLLAGILSTGANPANVRDGALLMELDGVIVEETTDIDPFEAFVTGETGGNEYNVHDLTYALDTAAKDDRIKAVVLDLSKFLGGGQVHLEAVGDALDRFKKAGKPVFVYSTYYGDDALMLSAHASEVWVNGLGGSMIAGPGGARLYYGDLLRELGVNMHVYKAGDFKSAVEPYIRNSMSPEARENAQQLLGNLWDQWKTNVTKARPKMNIQLVADQPAEWAAGANGNLAQASLNSGIVDKVGDRVTFGAHVRKVAGKEDWDERPGNYAHTDLYTWLADNPREQEGKAIGVITIAGEIVDGDAGPGTAGSQRIADVLDDALEADLAALVVRIDSPGGSVTASEQIRLAILRHKAQKIPVVVSMANYAASGGYWVATPGDRIFAEPSTVTGSIGVFAAMPTLEAAASKYGVSTDGIQTTPLSGQPNFVSGFSQPVNSILQGSVDSIYSDFLTRVGRSRNMSRDQVDKIGQGQVWDGGTARQLGLVDQFGGLEDALGYAVQKAGLDGEDWHPVFLGEGSASFSGLLPSLPTGGVMNNFGHQPSEGGDMVAVIARQQKQAMARFQADLARLSAAEGAQVYCLECAPLRRSVPSQYSVAEQKGWLAALGLLRAR